MKQSPTDQDLDVIIAHSATCKMDAAQAIRERYCIFSEPDEQELMRSIALNIVERHANSRDSIGIAHCIAIWSCIRDPDASRIRTKTGVDLAAHAMLPGFSHLFYTYNNTALAAIRKMFA